MSNRTGTSNSYPADTITPGSGGVLECERFEFCPEVTAKLGRRNVKIVEVPISYSARAIAEGKKIRWTDGVSAMWVLLRNRIGKNQ